MRETSPNGMDSFHSGDSYGICDQCGFKYRLSVMKKRWDGALVCKKDWEEQHPQEFLRGGHDRIKYPGDIRPEQDPNYILTPNTPDDL